MVGAYFRLNAYLHVAGQQKVRIKQSNSCLLEFYFEPQHLSTVFVARKVSMKSSI